MQFPIVNQYKIDLENINPENEIKGEIKKVAPGVKTRIIAPKHSPFFVNSLKMRFANGQPMEVDKHFRIFRLMNKLTEQAGEPIACLIELLDDNITEVEMDYDTVGEFSLIDNSFLQLIFNAVNDDRPVWWDDIDNKPTVYPPALHTHSLIYEVMAFQDVVELLNVFMGLLNSGDANYIEIRLNHYLDLINHYITVYGDMLRAFLKNHEESYNSHGLTAVQVGLENVDNFETATPDEVLTAGNDKHLTPAGLKNIVDVHGFNSKAFLESNVMPFSSYEALGGSFYPGTGWTVFFQTDQAVVFNGVSYIVPAGSIDLRDVDPNPANKTFYIYVKLDGGVPKYEVALDKRQETPFQLWIGTIVTGVNQISTIESQNVFAINGYRISENRCGGAIPASAGSINSVGQLPWLMYGDPGMPNPMNGLKAETIATLPVTGGWGSGLAEYNGSLYAIPASPVAIGFVSSKVNLIKHDPATGVTTTLAQTPEIFGEGFFMARIGGYIYVCGGLRYTSASTGPGLKFLHRYDIINSQWVRLADMPRARASGACCVYNNKIYLVGGKSEVGNNTKVPQVDVYDPATNTWSTLTTSGIGYEAAYPASILLGNKLLVIGGVTSDQVAVPMNFCGTLNLDTGEWEDVREYYDWTLYAHGGGILKLLDQVIYLTVWNSNAYLLGKPGRASQELPVNPITVGIVSTLQVGEAGYTYLSYTNDLIKITLQ